jgi:threonine dehydratase
VAVEGAAKRIAGHVRSTPVLVLEPGALGLPGRLTLKLEVHQHAGSFKARGAVHRLLTAGAGPGTTVVAASGGNHGVAVAWAAARIGCIPEIYIPSVSSPAKVARLRAFGADVRVAGAEYADAAAAALARTAELAAAGRRVVEVHPYDHPDVVAGAGTLGRELDHQAPGLDTVVVAVGGGGLLAGTGAWFGGRVRLVAVEPERCPTLTTALAAGQRVDVGVSGIGADALGARRIGAIAFATARELDVTAVTVPDDAIVAAQRLLWEELRVLGEPAGVASLAGLLAGAYGPEPGERVGVVLCGANADPAALA